MWDSILAILAMVGFLATLDNIYRRIQSIEKEQVELSNKLYDIEKKINPKRDGEYI